MKSVFQSRFKTCLEDFVAQKRALGFAYRTEMFILRRFDQMCLQMFPDESVLTKKIGDMWATLRLNESRATLHCRLAPVRELAKYLVRQGADAYLPESLHIPESTKRQVPHIFTDEELVMFFTAADRLEYCRRSPIRHLIVPVFFRLMYCCGLRPSETRLIRKEDIDFRKRTIKIRNSKGRKDRLVVMSEDVSLLCEKYFALTCEMVPGNNYFFPNWCKRHPYLASSWLFEMFHLCWDTSGIVNYSGKRPRPYDFRHSFATKRLYGWLREEKNLEARLPYLSAYMGHSNFTHTAYYIHLVPEYFQQMAGANLGDFEALLP
ncbi:tyrosine-type recombinase/integrase, partial [Desulfovibrio sp. OttesenSCG-928-C14]|nr:tyrosine-type recombinase/integrase [Desulfovibrio sp. OttesenSCG-928-C14]